MTQREVPDDPLLKPASEVGWDEAEADVSVERDPAAPRRAGEPRSTAEAKSTAERLAELSRSAVANKPAIDAKIAEAKANAKVEAAKAEAAKPDIAKADAAKPDAAKADAKADAAKPDAPKSVEAKASDAAGPAEDVAAQRADAPGEPATEAKPLALAVSKPADPDAALRDAIGATPLRRRRATEHDDEDLDVDGGASRSLKSIFLTIGGIVAVVVIGAFVVLGRLNTERYALTCEAERAVPQQGRAFPPWGIHALSGDAWTPLKIAPETRCQPRETDDARVLERWFLAMILDEVTARLTSRDPIKLDETDALLKQSLLLTRPPAIPEAETLAAERTAQHKEIERMLGDVTYWRAAAKLRDAATTLAEAAKQFDAAAAQRPRHVSDASDWGAYARKLAEQLRIGPSAGAPPSLGPAIAVAPAAEPSSPLDAPTPPRLPAPQGTALPVEPDKPGKPEAKTDESKPEAPKPDAPPAAPTAPTGGVLL